jgi:DNA-binding LacI/PurR family transcriptional regulator
MTRYHRHLSRKVEFARDAIVTWIHDRNLAPGDRLPPYSQLREELGLGSQTIAAAVGSLCEVDVLEVRDKVGIFVKNPEGGHLAGRTVAVAVRRLVGSSYAAMLAGFIQKLLNERNCRCLTFYQQSDPELEPRPGLGEFPGLEQAAAEHRFDGMISLCPFSDNALQRLDDCGVKYCFIGDDDHPDSPFSVLIDVQGFINGARRKLEQSGCRRIVQFCASPIQAERRRHLLETVTGCSYDGGAAIARAFLAQPPEKRPDGIVSDDDTIVSGFLAELVSHRSAGGAYLPLVATIIHEEIGERYPSPRMILYSQNVEEYANLAVGLLIKMMQGAAVNGSTMITYKFKELSRTRETGSARPSINVW